MLNAKCKSILQFGTFTFSVQHFACSQPDRLLYDFGQPVSITPSQRLQNFISEFGT
jgi:hypothetical protein